MSDKYIDIVFDGPPGPVAGRFVEVEQDGKSIGFGDWINDGDLWRLRFLDPRFLEARLEGMGILEQKRIARIAELEADKAKLKATVEHMDEICHTRETRIAALEREVKREPPQ